MNLGIDRPSSPPPTPYQIKLMEQGGKEEIQEEELQVIIDPQPDIDYSNDDRNLGYLHEEEERKGETQSSFFGNFFVSTAHFLTNRMRSSDEQFLLDLTEGHQIRDTIILFMPSLRKFVELLFPEYLEKMAAGDQQSLSQIAENFVIHLIANFGRELFADHVDRGEKISVATFVQGVGVYLIETILLYFVGVENTIKDSYVSEETFETLAIKLSDIALPKNQKNIFSQMFVSGEKRLIKGYTVKPLSKFLLMIYQKVILRQTSEAGPSRFDTFNEDNTNLSDIFNLIKQGSSFFIDALSQHFMAEENLFFAELTGCHDLPKVFSHLLSPLVDRITALIPKSLWQFLPMNDQVLVQNLFTSLVVKVIQQLAKNLMGGKKTSLSTLVFEINSFFMRTYEEEYSIIEKRRKEELPIKPKHFLPLVQALLRPLIQKDEDLLIQITQRFPGLEFPSCSFFKTLLGRLPELFTILSQILYDFDNAFQKDFDGKYIRGLRQLVWNPTEAAQRHSTRPLPLTATKSLSQAFGKENFVEQIHAVCVWGSELVMSYLTKKLKDITALVNIFHSAFPELINFSAHEKILKGFAKTFLSEDKSVCRMHQFLQKNIASFFLKACFHFLDPQRGQGHASASLFIFAFKRLFNVFVPHFQVIYGRLGRLNEDSLQRESFIRLSQDLFNHFTYDPSLSFEGFLAFPKWITQPVLPLLINNLLPAFLAKMSGDIRKLIEKKPLNRQRLYLLYQSHKPSEACRVMGHLVQELAPSILSSKHKAISRMILSYARDWIPQFARNKGGDFKELQESISRLAEFIGQAQKNPFRQVWRFINSYAEALCLQFFADFSERLQTIETHYLSNPLIAHEGSLKLRATFSVIQLITQHFQKVNEIKRGIGEKHASHVPPSLMLKKFDQAHILHSAMKDADPKAKEKYYQEQADRLISFLDLDENSLPIMDFASLPAWDVIKTRFLPLILEVLLLKITEPSTLHSLTLNMLKQLNNKIGRAEGEETSQSEIPDDYLERALEEECGSLAASILDLEPSAISSIANKFFEYRSFRNKVGKALAHPIRRKIDELTLLEFFELSITVFLPRIHRGRWSHSKIKEGEVVHRSKKRDRFIPLRVDRRGRLKQGFDFNLPKTEKKRQEQVKKETLDKKRLRVNLIKEMANTFSRQTKLTIFAGLKGMWQDFQRFINERINANFGEAGLKVKQFLDKVFRAILTRVISPVIGPIISLLFNLFWLTLSPYFKKLGRLKVDGIESPILKNLFYRIFENILKLLEKRNKTAFAR